MSLRTIIGWLSEEDLARFRMLEAKCILAASGRTDISKDEGLKCQVDLWEMQRDLRKRYNIDKDEYVGYSLADGAILEVDSE
jgi:hypothetical protein